MGALIRDCHACPCHMARLFSLSSLAQAAQASGGGKEGAQVVQSDACYYHYLCDGFNDRGWGCGYRSLQSLCSWAEHEQRRKSTSVEETTASQSRGAATTSVPTIAEIQSCLVAVGDKLPSFAGSREWIGCYEASIVLDQLYGVSCRIIHVPSGGKVRGHVEMLNQHFVSVGSPVMIGGDRDQASKTLIGISMEEPGGPWFLLADPHYEGGQECDASAVLTGGHVSWHSMELFQDDSFYNFCLPLNP